MNVTAIPDPPQDWVAVGTGLVALVAVLSRPLWRTLRHVVTIAHEGGHAGVAVLVGRRLRGVRLHSDTSGLTVSRGKPTGPGVVLVLLAGYVAPSVLGLAAAFAVAHGRSVATLWATVLLLGLLLLQIRNAFGVVSVVVTGVAAFAAVWWASVAWQQAVAHLLAWFLLLAGPVPVAELQAQRRTGRAATSDADQLAALTRVPGLFWVAVFLVLTVGALVLGGAQLLGVALP